jgi:hypothetical protein
LALGAQVAFAAVPVTSVWPYPATSSQGKTMGLPVDASSFAFKYSGAVSPTLDAAFSRYKDLMFPHVIAAEAAVDMHEGAAKLETCS